MSEGPGSSREDAWEGRQLQDGNGSPSSLDTLGLGKMAKWTAWNWTSGSFASDLQFGCPWSVTITADTYNFVLPDLNAVYQVSPFRL